MADKVDLPKGDLGPALKPSGGEAAHQFGRTATVVYIAIALGGAVFVTFVFTTLIHEPASIITLAGILVLSVALDYGWKHFRDTRTKNVQLAH